MLAVDRARVNYPWSYPEPLGSVSPVRTLIHLRHLSLPICQMERESLVLRMLGCKGKLSHVFLTHYFVI